MGDVVGNTTPNFNAFVMDKTGNKWWPMMGGVYFIVAKKRVVNMTLLKPSWKSNLLKSRLAVSSNPKSKPTQQKIVRKSKL